MISEILEKLREGLEDRSFEGSLKFDCGADGVIVLADGTATDVDQDTDCTLRLSTDNLAKLLTGKLNAMSAVMMGKIKISGNPAVAMKLADLLKG